VSDEKKLYPTAQSKELTDKIHRLVRKFSRDLAELVALEIGARAPKIQKKRGPPKGYKMPKSVCPVCQANPNSNRAYGFICNDCRKELGVGHRQKIKEVLPHHEYAKKDKLGRDYRVKVKLPEHRETAPKDVAIPDVEPDFLDSIALIAPPSPPTPSQESKEAMRPAPSSDDLEFAW
jgi:hypothetical protein